MKKTTIYFPEDLARQIKTRAMQERRTEAALIREAITVYLSNEKCPLPRIVGMVSNGSFDVAKDEEYSLSIGRQIGSAQYLAVPASVDRRESQYQHGRRKHYEKDHHLFS